MHRVHFSNLLRTFLLFVAVSFSLSAFSWGLTGHRVVGEIAQSHLTKKAKKELRKLIGDQTLAWWSNWADFVKSDTSYRYAEKWHYVDLPGHMQKEAFIDDLKKLPGLNLYTQITAMVQQLKDKSLSLEKRRFALYFLIHLVGDLHQPLHVGRDEDAGGNKIEVTWFGKKTNLHSVWDTDFIASQQYSYTEYSKLLNIATKDQVQSIQANTLEDWFYESHAMSDSIYDATPNESKLSYQYNYRFQRVLDQQLLKGGLRLAKLLNEALN
jgi:hypothetical protein